LHISWHGDTTRYKYPFANNFFGGGDSGGGCIVACSSAGSIKFSAALMGGAAIPSIFSAGINSPSIFSAGINSPLILSVGINSISIFSVGTPTIDSEDEIFPFPGTVVDVDEADSVPIIEISNTAGVLVKYVSKISLLISNISLDMLTTLFSE
jgi:hypothetical protein